jgi:hypothetical protein
MGRLSIEYASAMATMGIPIVFIRVSYGMASTGKNYGTGDAGAIIHMHQLS